MRSSGSSRYQHAYRFAFELCDDENLAHEIATKYIELYSAFPNKTNTEFFSPKNPKRNMNHHQTNGGVS